MDDFEAMSGEWIGDYELWLGPVTEPARSHTRARVDADDRVALVRYSWEFEDVERRGTMMWLRRDDERLELAWFDTFHTGGEIMTHTGESPGGWTVRGSYEGGGETWGWRTELASSGDELVVTAYNIAPDGTEHIATRATYRRQD